MLVSLGFSDRHLQVKWISDKPHKREWKKLELSLRDGLIKELLKNMERDNKHLADLLGHTRRMNAIKAPNITVNARKYERIRNHARNLFNALKHTFTWPCGCTVPHYASLYLQHRDAIEAAGFDQKQGFHFNILFFFVGDDSASPAGPPWDWREARIKPLDSSQARAPATAQVPSQAGTVTSSTITNTVNTNTSGLLATAGFTLAAPGGQGATDRFHGQSVRQSQDPVRTSTSSLPVRPRNVSFVLPESVLSNSQASNDESLSDIYLDSGSRRIEDLCKAMVNAKESSCLGQLFDEEERRHRVSITDVSCGRDPIQTVSLQDLLQTPLENKDRLIIGVKLASSLLQLHSTPWLTETWGKHDILFRKKADGMVLLSKPLLSKGFASPTCRVSPPQYDSPAIFQDVRNQGIFALGLLLIELCFGKTIDHVRAENGMTPQDRVSDIIDLATIRRLSDLVYKNAGDSYGDAVRRCINCDFDQRSDSLDSEALKEKVHWGVVSPLEQNLKFFCGGRLSEVLL